MSMHLSHYSCYLLKFTANNLVLKTCLAVWGTFEVLGKLLVQIHITLVMHTKEFGLFVLQIMMQNWIYYFLHSSP